MVTRLEDVYPPCWLYHETEEARIFETPEDVQAAIKEGWEDNPAKFADNRAKDLPAFGEMQPKELFKYALEKHGKKYPKNTKPETIIQFLIGKEK